MSDLSPGWAEATVADVASAMFDGPFGSALKTSDYTSDGVRVARLENIGHLRFRDELTSYVSQEKFEALARHTLRAQDVLFSSFVDKQTRVCLVPEALDGRMINKADCFCIRPDTSVCDPSWLAYTLAAPASYETFCGSVRGITRPRIGLRDLAAFSLSLPPLAEQRRIVAKLDALTARTARARADLDRVEKLAEQQRRTILSSAFRGELTKHWREARAAGPTPARDLRSELADHRASFIGEVRTSRRGPTADPEAGRKPVQLGELPPSWACVPLEEVTDPRRLIQYGILKPGDHCEDGVPYVKVMNIRGGVVELEKIRRTTPEIHAAYRRSSLRAGDLLLTIRGTVGRVAVVPAELDGGNITQDSVRIAVLPNVSARYVYWFLHSPAAQTYFQVNQKGVAVRGINVGDVRPMEIALPPEDEQVEIASRIDHAFAEIDRLVAEAAAARRLLDRLDQAILTKAFRGELVPQDPADEPASALLDRIRAERAAAPAKGRRGRRAA